MKRILIAIVPCLALVVATGCDLASLPSSVKDALTAKGISAGAGDQIQAQQRLQLMDGSCGGAGSQYQYGGSGNGGVDPGQGDQVRDSLHDGSCGDGNGG